MTEINQSMPTADSTQSDELVFEEASEETQAPETTEENSPESTDASIEAPKEAPKEPEVKEPEFLKIKYNGAEEGLTKDQTITLAQKGRNYDKVVARLEAMQNNPTLKVFAEQANRAGLSIDEYAQRLSEFQEQSQIHNLANEFKKSNPDVDDKIAEQYARQAYQNMQYQKKQNEAQRAQQAADIRRQTANEEMAVFMREYPNVDVRELPKEVIDDINSGQNLMSAYRGYENRLLRDQLAAERKNISNKRTSTGSVSENTASDESDPFLQGFLGK